MRYIILAGIVLSVIIMGYCWKISTADSDKASAETPLVGETCAAAVLAGSMKYTATGEAFEDFATFGAGCYWGTEKFFV